MTVAVASVALAVVLLALITALSRAARVDPEQLLATRFAKGEIDEAEYARRLAILRYGPPLELRD